MPRFLVICTYIGQLPSFFRLFSHSCRYVPELDFLILTDSEEPHFPLPPNVRVEKLTIADFQKRTRRALGISGPIHSGYKLNDYKPMYGDIFSDLLEGYDYWGSGDIDLIFSPRLADFITEGVAEDADIMNTSTLWLHGPLTLYKNTESMVKLYRKSKDWRLVVERPEHFAFDECGLKYKQICRRLGVPSGYYPGHQSYLDLEPDSYRAMQNFQCMTAVVSREHQAGNCRVFQGFVLRGHIEPGEHLEVRNGYIVDGHGVSWCAYHWVTEKARRKFGYPRWESTPVEFFISQYGFFEAGKPWFNRWLVTVRFAQAVLLLLHDRLIFHIGHLGIGPRPSEQFK